VEQPKRRHHDVAAVVKIREEYEKKGLSFYYHIDAAYGGYGRTMFLDEKGRFMAYEDLLERLRNLDVEKNGVPSRRKPVWKASARSRRRFGDHRSAQDGLRSVCSGRNLRARQADPRIGVIHRGVRLRR